MQASRQASKQASKQEASNEQGVCHDTTTGTQRRPNVDTGSNEQCQSGPSCAWPCRGNKESALAGVSSRVRHSLVGLWQAWKVDLEGKGMQWSTVCLV